MADENWVRVFGRDELSPGEMTGLEIGDSQIAVYNVNGTFYATDNICTHGFASLTDGFLEDDEIECPLHGGRFNVTNGSPAHRLGFRRGDVVVAINDQRVGSSKELERLTKDQNRMWQITILRDGRQVTAQFGG